MPRLASFALVLALVGCANSEGPAEARTGCDDGGLTGWSGELVTRQHGVTGTVEFVDSCTLDVQGFGFDGAGLDVRFVVADNPAFDDYSVLSDDLRRSGGYDGEALSFPLTMAVNPATAEHVSIWCVPAGVSFGDAVLVPPAS
ncbi:MAG: DM13 domain-containing protein [Deltaproteobacteria bacterium]|nr:DM13 domain-containing protein [Deltaproteobacteria bacterium]